MIVPAPGREKTADLPGLASLPAYDKMSNSMEVALTYFKEHKVSTEKTCAPQKSTYGPYFCREVVFNMDDRLLL
jgi:hypothetical protein